MALAINIEDLLQKQKIESNRIEFKKGWNPASVYHSVCAFANDIDDLGGGYILIGVEMDEHTGMAIRPVHGVPLEKIDKLLRDMVGYNNKISPYYMPRTSVEEVDGKQILVIWCPAGINRPYSVPENITSKSKGKEYFYIRSGTSSIVARGEVLEELRELELNGSPRAVVTTDDDRTYFRITIPCHQAFGNIIADVAHKDSLQRKRAEVAPKRTLERAPKNSSKHPPTKGEVRSDGSPKNSPKYALRKSWNLSQKAVYIIGKNQRVTISEMAEVIGVSRRSIVKATNKLQEEGIIRHIGPSKGGHWEVVVSPNN